MLADTLGEDFTPVARASWERAIHLMAKGMVVFTRGIDDASEIYVANVTGRREANLTNNAVADFNPAWSPDGMKIAFDSWRNGNRDVYVMNADGSGEVRTAPRSRSRATGTGTSNEPPLRSSET